MQSTTCRLVHALCIVATLTGPIRAAATEASQATPADNVAALAKAAAAIPVSAFFDKASISSVRLSPDGSKIAFLVPNEGKLVLAVFDRATGEARVILHAVNESFDSCAWKGNDHVLAYADLHGNQNYTVVMTDLTGKEVVKLHQKLHLLSILDMRNFDPQRVIAMDFDGSVVLLNIFNGQRHVCVDPSQFQGTRNFGLLFDEAGNVRIFLRQTRDETSLRFGNGATGKYTELLSWKAEGYPGVNRLGQIWLTRDGKTAYLTARIHSDRAALYALDTETGKWEPPIFMPSEGEIDDLIFSRDGMRLEGVSYEGDRRHYHWLDPNRAKVQASLEAAFPEHEVRVLGTSVDEKVLLIYVSSDRDPGAYFVVDRNAGRIDLFKRDLLHIDPRLMRQMEPIAFKARDGLEMHGYLTLPWAAEHGTVPLVVLPHGGPFDIRDSWGFDREVQFLASRGYAVAQVNYRGSGGYGADFIRAGRYQWGRKMQDDLTDAVHWLVEKGVADPKRVAIYGASYGGYAALAGVTLTPELYCCAANRVGPADMEITFHYRGSDAYWLDPKLKNARDGWVGPDRKYRDETSPILLIDRIRVPTLHAYGDNDPIIESAHWKRLKRRLTDAKKDFEFFIEKDQGHGFDSGEASIEFYEKLDAFFAKNLAPAR